MFGAELGFAYISSSSADMRRKLVLSLENMLSWIGFISKFDGSLVLLRESLSTSIEKRNSNVQSSDPFFEVSSCLFAFHSVVMSASKRASEECIISLGNKA